MTNPDRPARDEVAPGMPATEETPRGVPLGWESDEQPPPLDVPQGATAWGVTPDEEVRGEPLDERRKHEERDFPRRAAPSAFTLVDPGSDEGWVDEEAELVGELDPDGELVGPEEAAMHIVDEPPGANDDPDPGYVDDEDR